MSKFYILLTTICLMASVQVKAYEFPKKEGFRCMLDFSVGYAPYSKETAIKIAPVFGRAFGCGIFWGFGPEFTATIRGDVNYDIDPKYRPFGTEALGGYFKIRYTAVQIRSKVLPFVEVRGGYLWNFSKRWDTYGDYWAYGGYGYKGEGMGGFGIGASFKQRVRIGFFTHVNGERYYEYYEKKGYYYGYYEKKRRQHLNFAPSFFFTLDF